MKRTIKGLLLTDEEVLIVIGAFDATADLASALRRVYRAEVRAERGKRGARG